MSDVGFRPQRRARRSGVAFGRGRYGPHDPVPPIRGHLQTSAVLPYSAREFSGLVSRCRYFSMLNPPSQGTNDGISVATTNVARPTPTGPFFHLEWWTMKHKTPRFGDGFCVVLGNRRSHAEKMVSAPGRSRGNAKNRHSAAGQCHWFNATLPVEERTRRNPCSAFPRKIRCQASTW